MEKEYSGNIKLRLPKTLHEKLIEAAQNEGISLNQYCIYLLSEKLAPYFLGRRKLNSDLISIRNKIGTEDLPNLVNYLKPLIEKVLKLEPLLKDYLSNMNTLSIQDESDLELKYPVLITRSTKSIKFELKIPTLKLVFKPTYYNYDTNTKVIELLKQKLQSNSPTVLTQVNIDELNYNMSPDLNKEDLKSIVIYFVTSDLDEITKIITDLTDTIKEYKDSYSINYYPIYYLKALN